MSNTTISPNMGLPVPVVGTDPGPDWANNINACLSVIDQHNHTSGQGVPIPSAGLNINSDLPFNNNNGISYRSVRFFSQGAPIPASSPDLGCLYVSGADLYYNDENGNQVRITQGGSVTGSSGTITGLPSGTASASYSTGVFTFQGATSTPATMAIGPIVLGQAVASSNTITIAPNSGIAANYNLTLPAAPPASVTSVMTMDTSGNVGTTAGPTLTGSSIVGPTFSGTASGTITGGTYSPTMAVISSNGSALTARTFFYQRINNTVIVYGTFTITTSSGGGFSVSCSLPVNPSGNFATTYDLTGSVSGIANPNSGTFIATCKANTGTKTADLELAGAAGTTSITAYISFSYSCA